MKSWKLTLSGGAAGTMNGLFGAGGGMVLVPMLTKCDELNESSIFPASVAMILPICLVSLLVGTPVRELPWMQALPYLLGSIPGGLLAGYLDKKIPVKWLHRVLGLLIIWGGVRYLC